MWSDVYKRDITYFHIEILGLVFNLFKEIQTVNFIVNTEYKFIYCSVHSMVKYISLKIKGKAPVLLPKSKPVMLPNFIRKDKFKNFFILKQNNNNYNH